MKKQIILLVSFFSVFCLSLQAQTAATDSLKQIVAKAEQGDARAQNQVGAWYYKGEHYKQDYQKAFAWWAKAAKQDNADAIGNMGLCYQYGRGVEKDSVMAIKLYLKSIEKGNAGLLKQRLEYADHKDNFNCVLVALCYQNGTGMGKDLQKATQYWETAAKNNSADAQRELAFALQRAKKTNDAALWFKKAADNGDIPSAYQYGKIQLAGKTADQDKQGGIIYLLKAAENGHIQAQCDLGTLYYQGNGVAKDMHTAVQWFMKSARQGWPLAQWNLAQCYIKGEGIERDFDQAIYWLGESTSKGYMAKFKELCEDAQKGWKDQPFMFYLQGMAHYFSESKDLAEAIALFKKCEKADIMESKTMMAVCLANKNYKKRNPKKAAKLLTETARQNHVAQFYLASLYEAGNGVKKDMDKAIELYGQSANGGYAVAQCYLGNMYYEGRSVTQDYTQAVNYYRLADRQGQLNAIAARRYADCYEQGLGGLAIDKQNAEILKKQEHKNNVIPMLKTVVK